MSRERKAVRPPGGLSAADLVSTCFDAFQSAREGVGLPTFDWAGWDEADQAAFTQVVTEKAGEIDDENADETPVSARAEALALLVRFHKARGTALPEETQLGPKVTLPWEAVLRHTMNMLALATDEDATADPASHATYWREWAADRLRAAGLPDHQAQAEAEAKRGGE